MSDETIEFDLVAIQDRLQDRVGIDPKSLHQVLKLADLGVVLLAWRNGPVEDLHAGSGPLSDGDMLRINSYTTWRIRGITDRWRRELSPSEGLASFVPQSVTYEDFESLAIRWYRWLVSPNRILPGNMTLSAIAGPELHEVQDHVDSTLGDILHFAEHRGTDAALLLLATEGAFRASQWWGHPRWPQLVDRFIVALGDAGNEHWGPVSDWRDRLHPEPPEVVDRRHLRTSLRTAPWGLRVETAEWLVRAGIGCTRLAEDR